MGWKQHVQRLLIAGGTLALADCQGCCNANPDPCCYAPKGQECKVKEDCAEMGQGYTYGLTADGAYGPMCELLDAAMPDLPLEHDLAVADASDGGGGDAGDGGAHD